MKTFKQYVNEAEEQLNRRGFLKGLAAFAASAAVPAPVVKLLSTPAGVATMPIPAGIALIKGVIDHLNQWDAEDDDDLFDAQEDMASDLGFEGIEPDYDDEDRGDDISATDQMFELLDLYRKNPEQAAAQLIKHLQSVAIDSKDIETSFKSRADNPDDWRYQNKLKEPDDSEPYDYYASNTPEENKIVIYKTDFDGNIGDTYVRDNRETDPVEELKRVIRSDGSPSGSRFHKYTKFTATSGGKPVKIDSEKYIDPSKLSNALSPDQVREKMYKMWQANIDPYDNSSTGLANISRLAGLAKGIAGGDNQEPAPTVKDMGPVQYAKDTPALPTPTKPEVDLTPNLKSKEKVPVQRKGDDAMSEKLGDNRPKLGTKRDQGKSVRKWRKQHNLDESTELSGILKNAGLKS